MASKKEIADQIAKLQADLENAGDEDEFEVEIRDGDKSARVPGSKAAAWLKENFGIGAETGPSGEERQDDGDDDDDKGKGKPGGSIWGRK